MNLLNKIILLITDSYLYIILSIPFILLVYFFQSRDTKEIFDKKLFVLNLIFTLLIILGFSVSIIFCCKSSNPFLCFKGSFLIIISFYVCSFLSYLCREKLLLIHQNISKLLVAFILSFIFIIAISITPFEYLILSFLILLFMLISYSCSKNVKVFLYTSILLILNLMFFCIKNSDTLIQCKINDINISVFYWVYIIILGLFLIISSILYLKDDKKDVKDNNKSKNLFSERKYDLERIIEYLGQYNLIGLNADWGNGKSFLFEMLTTQEKDKYYFINISVLTMRIEKIESYVINEICNILEKNRIFTQSSKRIKGLFQQSFFHDLGELFFGFNSYMDAIKKLKTEVMKLERPIIITFEDIDRVSDKDIIYKIFALADVINDAKIKIVFQYEEKKLLNILEENKDYIEKYIQHTLTLTSIPFEIMMKKFLSKPKYSLLKDDDFSFLKSPQVSIPNDLQQLLNTNLPLPLNRYNYNIRKFEIFFDDIILDLKAERFKDIYEYKQKIILFYFIKHFDYAFFECLKDDISFTDTKMFSFNNNMYSIVDLLKRIYNKKLNNNDTEMILKNDTNRIRMIYYILFGFDSSIIIRNIEYEKKITKATTPAEYLTEILNQDIKELKAQEDNDKINRMIKNLISFGKSENTDFEIAVKEMNEQVLNRPKEEQEEGYRELSKIMYNGNFEKSDNQTVFRIGIASKFSLFQAYLCCENSSEQWNKLIDFFIKPDTKINSQLIQTLNYCKIDDKKVFLHIINRFSELEIIGNLNKTISYKNFIITYFNAIKTHGFSTKMGYLSKDMFDRIDMKSFFVNSVIPDCLNDFKKLKKLSNNKDIQSEIIILEKFVKHNLNILKNEVELQEHTPKLKVSYTSHDSYDSIVKKSEEYKKMKLTKEQLQKILDEQYLKGEISMYEYRCYMINVLGEKL